MHVWRTIQELSVGRDSESHGYDTLGGARSEWEIKQKASKKRKRKELDKREDVQKKKQRMWFNHEGRKFALPMKRVGLP